jgi:hypothetical protein
VAQIGGSGNRPRARRAPDGVSRTPSAQSFSPQSRALRADMCPPFRGFIRVPKLRSERHLCGSEIRTADDWCGSFAGPAHRTPRDRCQSSTASDSSQPGGTIGQRPPAAASATTKTSDRLCLHPPRPGPRPAGCFMIDGSRTCLRPPGPLVLLHAPFQHPFDQAVRSSGCVRSNAGAPSPKTRSRPTPPRLGTGVTPAGLGEQEHRS